MVLAPIDSLSITLLTDNYTDRLLPTLYPATRAPMIKNGKFLPPPPPIAEHGFSAFIRAMLKDYEGEKGGSDIKNKETTILFDCGTSENGVLHNADILGMDLQSVRTIVLSHGHFDHFTGLVNILRRINKPTRLVCHPDAFLKRWIIFPDGKENASLPFLDKDLLKKYGASITIKEGPSQISDSGLEDYHEDSTDNEVSMSPKLLITGQIPRVTSFEKGFPMQFKEDTITGQLIHDPLVKDDQAIIAHIRNRGLVIISGCAHAGIINTVRYAKSLSGIDKVYAIIGGFHLTGGVYYEEAIDPTILRIKEMDPNFLIPCHCTGSKATNRIMREFPDKFIQPTVCATFTFDSKD